MKPQLVLFLTLSLLCIGTGAALAQTPDGFPPALETVCDMEQGAAYGHCNAYCEAMDCELANDGDPSTNPSASATACSKVRNKFQQATGRDLPCEVTCPCNVPRFPAFSEIVAGQFPIAVCRTEPAFGSLDGIFVGNVTQPFALAAQLASGQWFCGDFLAGTIPITPAQGQFCAQLLEQAANSQNVTCN
ncbi:MAG TPA: hypothetical protein VKK31_11345 [Thermoanaerobaculia bacterium]|nr:hypothetical protein [Thermoanaerobaculia bacterium]